MVKYRLHGPKHSAVTEGKVYDLTPEGRGFGFLDDDGEERWTLLSNSIHCERFELVSDSPIRAAAVLTALAGALRDGK